MVAVENHPVYPDSKDSVSNYVSCRMTGVGKNLKYEKSVVVNVNFFSFNLDFRWRS